MHEGLVFQSRVLSKCSMVLYSLWRSRWGLNLDYWKIFQTIVLGSSHCIEQDQHHKLFWCLLELLDNYEFLHLGIQIRIHVLKSEHWPVSICDNSVTDSFIFGFPELSHFSFLYHFIVIICREAECRFVKTVTALSAKIEARRGVVSGFFEHAFLSPNMISIEAQLEVLNFLIIKL